jgi:hypothetical protein
VARHEEEEAPLAEEAPPVDAYAPRLEELRHLRDGLAIGEARSEEGRPPDLRRVEVEMNFRNVLWMPCPWVA